MLCLFQYAHGFRIKHLAFRCKPGATLFSIEQFQSELFLQFDHSLAQRRLGDVLLSRGLAISIPLNYRCEVTQMSQFQGERHSLSI